MYLLPGYVAYNDDTHNGHDWQLRSIYPIPFTVLCTLLSQFMFKRFHTITGFSFFFFFFPREGSSLKALVYTKCHIDSTDSKRLDCFTLESVILIIVSYCFQVPMVKGTYTVQWSRTVMGNLLDPNSDILRISIPGTTAMLGNNAYKSIVKEWWVFHLLAKRW